MVISQDIPPLGGVKQGYGMVKTR